MEVIRGRQASHYFCGGKIEPSPGTDNPRYAVVCDIFVIYATRTKNPDDDDDNDCVMCTATEGN